MLCACPVVFHSMTPWIVAPWALLPMGFSRQGYWSGLPLPPPEDLPDPGIKPVSPASPALQADSLPLSQLGTFNTSCTCSVFSLQMSALCKSSHRL